MWKKSVAATEDGQGRATARDSNSKGQTDAKVNKTNNKESCGLLMLLTTPKHLVPTSSSLGLTLLCPSAAAGSR